MKCVVCLVLRHSVTLQATPRPANNTDGPWEVGSDIE